ncbi:hypothetical protein D5045_10795 [Verminephrobacter eiseniae]|uniref:winged helix-turn-helix domain-containing protein n=1 Tax=Verminephrobacter eiseniae TaxID=364317 RepID=UPI002A57EB06|nr:hypothetical protein [Verminephrobacter eiseniae]
MHRGAAGAAGIGCDGRAEPGRSRAGAGGRAGPPRLRGIERTRAGAAPTPLKPRSQRPDADCACHLLHRHGWRKPAPDKRHPQSDPLAQQEWGKNAPKRATISTKIGRKAKPSS